jgi:Ribbon-helix-helix domain
MLDNEPKPRKSRNETGKLLGKRGGFINVAVTAEQKARLEALTQGGLIPISKLVRKAIEDFLAANEKISEGREVPASDQQ